MKKRDRKLLLHRETVRHLDRGLPRNEMGRVLGNGPHTSETTPCCGKDPDTVSITIEEGTVFA
jgi:hypothetical protein